MLSWIKSKFIGNLSKLLLVYNNITVGFISVSPHLSSSRIPRQSSSISNATFPICFTSFWWLSISAESPAAFGIFYVFRSDSFRNANRISLTLLENISLNYTLIRHTIRMLRVLTQLPIATAGGWCKWWWSPFGGAAFAPSLITHIALCWPFITVIAVLFISLN